MALKKLPRCYSGIVSPMILSLFMTAVVSAISLLRAQGLSMATAALWPQTWALS